MFAQVWSNIWGWLTNRDIHDQLAACIQRDHKSTVRLEQVENTVTRLRLLMLVAWVRVSRQGRIMNCDDVFAEITGYTQTELVGMHIERLMQPRIRALHEQVMTELCEGKRKMREGYLDVMMVRKDHNLVLTLIKPFWARDGDATVFDADIRLMEPLPLKSDL